MFWHRSAWLLANSNDNDPVAGIVCKFNIE
jgi:hypothetical protein